jgi:hypothetical protein
MSLLLAQIASEQKKNRGLPPQINKHPREHTHCPRKAVLKIERRQGPRYNHRILNGTKDQRPQREKKTGSAGH